MRPRIALAYSGGLYTTIAIPWLSERYNADVVAVTLDVGHRTELESVRDRALAAGAARAHVLDVREEFAGDYLLRALKADAIFRRRGQVDALVDLVVARKTVEIARIEQAEAIAHGGDPAGRLPMNIRALDSGITILAVPRDCRMTDREAVDYARARGIHSGLSAGGAGLESRDSIPVRSAGDAPYAKGRMSGAGRPVQPAYVDITFDCGVPIAVNGVAMPLVDLIASLTTIAGVHAIDRVEPAGTPATTLLRHAHKALQKLVTSKETDRFSRTVSAAYADSIETGLWFTPLREALDAFVDKIQERVTGDIRMKLWKGDCRIVRRTPRSRLPTHDYSLVRAV